MNVLLQFWSRSRQTPTSASACAAAHQGRDFTNISTCHEMSPADSCCLAASKSLACSKSKAHRQNVHNEHLAVELHTKQ